MIFYFLNIESEEFCEKNIWKYVNHHRTKHDHETIESSHDSEEADEKVYETEDPEIELTYDVIMSYSGQFIALNKTLFLDHSPVVVSELFLLDIYDDLFPSLASPKAVEPTYKRNNHLLTSIIYPPSETLNFMYSPHKKAVCQVYVHNIQFQACPLNHQGEVSFYTLDTSFTLKIWNCTPAKVSEVVIGAILAGLGAGIIDTSMINYQSSKLDPKITFFAETKISEHVFESLKAENEELLTWSSNWLYPFEINHFACKNLAVGTLPTTPTSPSSKAYDQKANGAHSWFTISAFTSSRRLQSILIRCKHQRSSESQRIVTSSHRLFSSRVHYRSDYKLSPSLRTDFMGKFAPNGRGNPLSLQACCMLSFPGDVDSMATARSCDCSMSISLQWKAGKSEYYFSSPFFYYGYLRNFFLDSRSLSMDYSVDDRIQRTRLQQKCLTGSMVELPEEAASLHKNLIQILHQLSSQRSVLIYSSSDSSPPSQHYPAYHVQLLQYCNPILRLNLSIERYSTERSVYEAPVLADAKYGLGLRLSIKESSTRKAVIIENFKRHPTTGDKFHAESSGKIQIGDELISINQISLQGLDLSTVISTIRSVLKSNQSSDPEFVVNLKLFRPSSDPIGEGNIDDGNPHHWECSSQHESILNLDLKDFRHEGVWTSFHDEYYFLYLDNGKLSLYHLGVERKELLLYDTLHLQVESDDKSLSTLQVWFNDEAYLCVSLLYPALQKLSIYRLRYHQPSQKRLSFDGSDQALHLVSTNFTNITSILSNPLSSYYHREILLCTMASGQTCLLESVTSLLNTPISMKMIWLSDEVRDVMSSTKPTRFDQERHLYQVFWKNDFDIETIITASGRYDSNASSSPNEYSPNILKLHYLSDPAHDLQLKARVYFDRERNRLVNYQRIIFHSMKTLSISHTPYQTPTIETEALSQDEDSINPLDSSLMNIALNMKQFVDTQVQKHKFQMLSILMQRIQLLRYSWKALLRDKFNPPEKVAEEQSSSGFIPIAPDFDPHSSSSSSTLYSVHDFIGHDKFVSITSSIPASSGAIDHNALSAAQAELTKERFDSILKEIIGSGYALNALLLPTDDQASLFESMFASNIHEEKNPWSVVVEVNEIMSLVAKNDKDVSNQFSFQLLASASSKNTAGVNIDILDLCVAYHVGFWLRDMHTPQIKKVFTAAVLEQYKTHRDISKIFLDLILSENLSLLTQLARSDRTDKTCQQILKLLTTIEFGSEEGQNSLRKNAFALMRVRKYRMAAGVFLLADPPMVKEAINVLAIQNLNPELGYLVGRFMEKDTGGYLLGAHTRELLRSVYLDYLKSDSIKAIERDDMGLLRGLWLQDPDVIAEALKQVQSSAAMISYSLNPFDDSHANLCYQLNLFASYPIALAFAHIYGSEEIIDVFYLSLQRILSAYDLHEEAVSCYSMYRSHTRDASTARKQLEQLLAPFLQHVVDKYKHFKAREQSDRKKPNMAPRSALDAFDPPSRQISSSIASSAPRIALDAFDPPSRTAPRSALDAFDPPSRQPSASAPRSALDAFDPPSRTAPQQTSTPRSALDAFDPPSRAAPRSALDAFDPPSRQPSASAPQSALDAFDPPSRTAPQQTSAPRSALDAFDPPSRAAPRSALDAFDPPSRLPPQPASVAPRSALDDFDPPSRLPPQPASVAPRSALDAFDPPSRQVPQPVSTVGSAPRSALDDFEPPSRLPPQPVLSHGSHDQKSIEERVREFYLLHNKSKLSTLPDILAKYKGREEVLLAKLKKQYHDDSI
jgi:hypothetical protein